MDREELRLNFGTDGIRGEANRGLFRPEPMVALGRTVARVLQARELPLRVIMGRDTRRSSSVLQATLAGGFISEGGQMVLTGIIPTPALSYLTVRGTYPLGIVITASHNPASDNGVKFFDSSGGKLEDDFRSQMVEEWERVIAVDWRLHTSATPLGRSHREMYGAAAYLDFLRSTLPANSEIAGWKVVVDCAHGATYQMAPELLRSVGAEVIAVGNRPDGDNINLQYGALYPERVSAEIARHGADIGIAFDGDGDRIVIATPERALSGDECLYLCATDLKRRNELRGNHVVVTEYSGMGLVESLRAQGIEVAISGVGDHLVTAKMRELRASFGGESSGHIIFGEYAPSGDGLLAALQILARYPRERWRDLRTMLEGYRELPRVSTNIAVVSTPEFSRVPELEGALERARALLGAEGRLLVRYSGTEPVIRLLAEHQEMDTARDALQMVAGTVEEHLT